MIDDRCPTCHREWYMASRAYFQGAFFGALLGLAIGFMIAALRVYR